MYCDDVGRDQYDDFVMDIYVVLTIASCLALENNRAREKNDKGVFDGLSSNRIIQHHLCVYYLNDSDSSKTNAILEFMGTFGIVNFVLSILGHVSFKSVNGLI